MSNVDGIFDAKAVRGSEQWGPSVNGHLQLRLILRLKGEGEWPTDLIFSPDSAHFSEDRLRAMGWDGKYNGDAHERFPGLPCLDSIFGEADKPESGKVFKVRRKTDMYQGAPQTKVEIYTGAAPIAPYASADGTKQAGAKLREILKGPKPERKRNAGGSSGEMPDDDYFRS